MPKKKSRRPTTTQSVKSPEPVGPAADPLRAKDGQILGEAALLVENAATAITDALAVLSRTSLVINLARSTSELNRPLPQLQELARVLEFAGAALIDNGELATRPDRPVELGAHISPHQIDLFARLAEFNTDDKVRLGDVYDRVTQETERTQPQKQTPIPVSTVDEQYQTSLRNELQGIDVGAEVFWNAVQSLPCTYCDAKAGKPCMTSGGWPSVTYHRPRRNEAATEFRQPPR